MKTFIFRVNPEDHTHSTMYYIVLDKDQESARNSLKQSYKSEYVDIMVLRDVLDEQGTHTKIMGTSWK